MTNQEAIEILTRHNAWRRDNETYFPELPDSPALIGEAIDAGIDALARLERIRIERMLHPKTRRELMAEDDLAQAIILLRTLADLQNGPPLYEERKKWENVMTKTYKFLWELE